MQVAVASLGAALSIPRDDVNRPHHLQNGDAARPQPVDVVRSILNGAGLPGRETHASVAKRWLFPDPSDVEDMVFSPQMSVQEHKWYDKGLNEEQRVSAKKLHVLSQPDRFCRTQCLAFRCIIFPFLTLSVVRRVQEKRG
jgi:hypothetical protein